MWRRVYLALLLVRIYFAQQPSYIHPDEHFQGPEIVAGDVFHWKITRTWEFQGENPIRSVLPLWLAFGLPMQVLQWLTGSAFPHPIFIYYTLRIIFFLISFVLEDWALQELIKSTRARHGALLLLSSSYVTWTYQTHTFSNALETIAVLWSLVLMKRIYLSKDSAVISSALLGAISVFGVFNRITFPSFILFPSLLLIKHFTRYPLAFAIAFFSALVVAYIGIYIDTAFYSASAAHMPSLLSIITTKRVITPLNSFLYNSNSDNLSQHGLHPRYYHLLVNIPQLLGPAFLCLTDAHLTIPLLSAISGITVLSLFKHQEARFLLPCVPLILSSINIPRAPTLRSLWITTWIMFNITLGILMGVFHQGGVIPIQAYISANLPTATTVFWWKTYSPPTWLLGPLNEKIRTVDWKGAPWNNVVNGFASEVHSCKMADNKNQVYFVAPLNLFNGTGCVSEHDKIEFVFEKVYKYTKHLGLDDLNTNLGPNEGLWDIAAKVWDQRGLTIWQVYRKECSEKGSRKVGR